ncbi:hypothetical protein E2C01_056987 [Portunus trituberculatus]|uniref:Uncharacterized protein n=1 Tax=Portunus trituberculatus TaxID=210409 RepID=A0A5B7H0L9_PORTR|nr:hypothetical protein [Portunus trituberculatus]
MGNDGGSRSIPGQRRQSPKAMGQNGGLLRHHKNPGLFVSVLGREPRPFPLAARHVAFTCLVCCPQRPAVTGCGNVFQECVSRPRGSVQASDGADCGCEKQVLI